MRSPLAEALAALARALKRLDARWYLFGAQAALLYGAARLTADIDVTVQFRDRETSELARAPAQIAMHQAINGDRPHFPRRERR